MTQSEFLNGLKLLRSIDRHEIDYPMREQDWITFRDHPVWTFIKMEGAMRDAVWDAMVKRMPV